MSATIETAAQTKHVPATVEELDEYFDNGGSVAHLLDHSTAVRPNLEVSKVNVDMPRWLIVALDKAAKTLAIPRQAVIKTLLARALREGAGQI